MLKHILIFLVCSSMVFGFDPKTKTLASADSDKYMKFSYQEVPEQNWYDYYRIKTEYKLTDKLKFNETVVSICTFSTIAGEPVGPYRKGFAVSYTCFLPEGCEGYQLHNAAYLGFVEWEPNTHYNSINKDLRKYNKGNQDHITGDHFDTLYVLTLVIGLSGFIPYPNDPVKETICYINWGINKDEVDISQDIDITAPGWEEITYIEPSDD